jgi:signal transduction histidine kinase
VKNLKAHHHLAIMSMLVFGVVSVWTWGTLVMAINSNTQIQLTVGPPDACNNIAGYQETVPNGMLVDGSGNCYTPPPPPTDMCNNISGMQETVPSGYYRDSSGNCFPQPTPPVDVCPNLSGTQTSVPDGYEMDANGRCVIPPTDMCDNIPGTQILIPEGMERGENGTCFTPAPVASPNPPVTPTKPENPWVAPTQPRAPTANNRLMNVPQQFEGFVRPIVDAVPEEVKEALRSVPPATARAFPYYIFAVLAAAALIMTWQTLLEVAASRRLLALLKREKDIAEEKDNFIALASHYLRTPLTLMQGSLDTGIATKALTEETAAPLKASLNSLDAKIGEVLSAVESNTALAAISEPVKKPSTKSFVGSVFFWLPILATIVIVVLSNFLLGVVGEVDLGTTNLIVQVVVFASVSMFFYSTIRSYHIRKVEHGYREQLITHEETIDRARNDFIAHTNAILVTELANINMNRAAIQGSVAQKFFDDGYERFEHLLQKFSLLSEIQAGVLGATEKFDIRNAIDETIRFYQPKLEEKRLTIVNNITHTSINQRRSLFDFVLGSLIDNAIKFSHDGGTITISSTPHEKTLTVQVVDYGVGIPEEKMSQLFKPFSRGTSAMEFNYEGLGFSLFLDKIIMDYVGGSIVASSTADKNTTFRVTTKTA